jgi:hypothetical protein
MESIKNFILSLLTWVGDSPLRLFSVILLCTLSGAGWFLYTEKDAFMSSYRAQQALPKMNGNYEAAAAFIIKNSTAELVAIYEVNTLLNTRKLVYFATRSSGRDKLNDGTEVGLLTKNYENNNDVIGLMSGKIPCSPYLRPQSYMGFVYKEHGIEFMCRVSVPPEAGTFIGQISVGWRAVVADPAESQTILLIASGLLFGRK